MKQNYGTDTLHLHMKKLLFFCIFKHCWAAEESWKSVVGVLESKRVGTLKYKSCLLYCSKTWPVKVEHEVTLNRTEITMIRWICAFTLKERKMHSEDNCSDYYKQSAWWLREADSDSLQHQMYRCGGAVWYRLGRRSWPFISLSTV